MLRTEARLKGRSVHPKCASVDYTDKTSGIPTNPQPKSTTDRTRSQQPQPPTQAELPGTNPSQ